MFGKLFLILIFFSASAHSEITKTDNLSPIQAAIEAADENTLVVFDIDDVFIRPQDQILHLAHTSLRDKLIEQIKNKVSFEDFMMLSSIVYLAYKTVLVDPKILDTLALLKERNIKHIALTAAWTGKMGRISSIEQWRVETLKNLGIDFSGSFPDFKEIIFTDLNSLDPGRFPMFKDGILLTCKVKKGKVLARFLQEYYSRALLRTGPAPQFTRIIFIDDLRKNLESVAHYCQDANIEFQGFEYTASKKQAEFPLNEKRAKMQFDILQQEQRWASDSEVDSLLGQ